MSVLGTGAKCGCAETESCELCGQAAVLPQAWEVDEAEEDDE